MRNTGTEYASTEATPVILPEMAQLLPPLTGEQLAALEADLLANGCYSPVIVNEDMVIVDGHHRHELCEKHGIPYKMAVFTFADMLEAKQWALDTQNDNEYTLKLYTALRVDVAEAGGIPMELPDPDIPTGAARRQFTAYHGAVLAAIQADPPKKDVTSLFKSDFMSRDEFRETGEKINSMIQTVEDVEGKFFGVTVCQVRGKLDDMDMVLLTGYCRALHDENAEVKRYHCPANESHGELSVHIWRDRSRFMLTEQEMERAPWRKPRQKSKGGDAR